MFETISVLGGGAWGTALALAAARAGRKVVLWTRDTDHAEAMQRTRENAPRLPGIPLPETIRITASLKDAADSARAILLAVPAQSLRGVTEALSLVVKQGIPIIICAKGIDQRSGEFMSEIVTDTIRGAMPGILSGPSFAVDVAKGLPTAIVLAAPLEPVSEALARALSSPAFRIYHSTDIRGVEIGGAAKNVLAIAAGIVEGRGLGDSARAAITARGFAELSRLARSYGAKPETLMGLSGLGDLVLTCASRKSRNFAFGDDLGRGLSLSEAGGGKLAEGVHTARILVDMARARRIDMPIAEAVADILVGRISIQESIDLLLMRPLKTEYET
jgi:glycerol-3-phosphate dehydrogenase (NAD(P)+)